MSRQAPHILGEVLFDCFPDGRRVLGGAPFNVAWHLAGFGRDPLFLSAVGDDEPGREILARMKSHGMRTEGVRIHPSLGTGRVDVKNAESSPEYHFPERSAWDEFSPDGIPSDATPSILYQGTLFMRHEVSREASLALAKSASCPRFVDVNLRAPWFDPGHVKELVTGVHCLKASDEELGMLAGWFGIETVGGREETARRLLEAASIHHALITLGADGAVWITADGGVHHAAAASVRDFVDSVGAGDASAAVALLGLTENWPVPLILERAMRFAAAICEIPGAIPDDHKPYHETLRS